MVTTKRRVSFELTTTSRPEGAHSSTHFRSATSPVASALEGLPRNNAPAFVEDVAARWAATEEEEAAAEAVIARERFVMVEEAKKNRLATAAVEPTRRQQLPSRDLMLSLLEAQSEHARTEPILDRDSAVAADIEAHGTVDTVEVKAAKEAAAAERNGWATEIRSQHRARALVQSEIQGSQQLKVLTTRATYKS